MMSHSEQTKLPSAALEPMAVEGDFAEVSPALRFAAACSKVEADRLREGIGTLGEKTLHAVLKHYYEPNPTFHEQKIGSYFADIAKDGEIIEIQTRSLYRLREKIAAFLSEGYRVKVVHPLPRHRWLYWIDGEGNLSNRRKSPKIGKLSDALPELSTLSDLLFQPNFTVVVILLDVEDFRNLDGWSKDKKKGSTRFERMPVAYVEEHLLRAKEDLRAFLPQGLPDRFTSQEFYKKVGYKGRNAYYALKLMEKADVIRKVGEEGRKFLFEVNPNLS